MKTLFISDLDGTLLNRQERLSERTVELLNSLIQKGLHFSYATARSLSSAARATQGIMPVAPVVLYNGGTILNPATHETLRFLAYTPKQVKIAAELFQAHHVSPIVYSMVNGQDYVSWMAGTETRGMNEYLSKRKDDPRFTVCHSWDEVYRGQPFYFTCIGELEEIQPIEKELHKFSYWHALLQKEIYSEDAYWCEIMPWNATKANGVLFIKEKLGFDRIVCFGDGLNDISMFQAADECYAMANAEQQLKSVATAVINSNDEDGVALWLAENYTRYL